MAYNGAVIDIALSSDIEGFITDLKSQLKSVKKLGVDVDTSSIEEALQSYMDAIKKISNAKLNTSTFAKSQESLSKEIGSLQQRMDNLEKGFTGLVDVMNSVDGGKFASELQQMKQDMQGLADATANTINTMRPISSGGTASAELKETLSVLEEISKVKAPKFEAEDDFKTAKKKLVELYNEINAKKRELNAVTIVSDEDKLRVANLLKEIMELSSQWQSLFSTNYSAFEDQFDGAFVTAGKKRLFFDNLSDSVEKTMTDVRDTVDKNISYIKSSISSLDVIETVSSANVGPNVKVHAELATTTKGLKTQLTNLLDSIQPYLDSNPLEIGVTIATEWGTRRNKELLKQFQTQIDNISEDTDVTALYSLYDDIQKTFGNEISLKFKSNFDEEQKAIRAGVTALKAEIGKRFELNPKISESAATKMQSQLDKLSKNLVLSINQVRLTDGAIQQAAELESAESSKAAIGVEALAAIMDVVIEKAGELNEQFIPVKDLLVDIKSILEQTPIDSILESTKELVRVMQQAFNILSQEDLDKMFNVIQGKVATIQTDTLKKGNTVNQLKSLLSDFREYQNLGGQKTLVDLGGADNVQRWFKRNKDIILETTDAVEKLDKAQEKVFLDNGESSMVENLGSALDAVIKKVQDKTEAFVNEESVVSQTTAKELQDLDMLLKKLNEIKSIFDRIVNTENVYQISSALISAFDGVLAKVNEIASLVYNVGSLSENTYVTPIKEYLDILEQVELKLKEISTQSDGVKITNETTIDAENIEKIIVAIKDLQNSLTDIQTALSDGTIFKGLGNITPEDAENISKVTTALSELAKVMPSENFGKSIEKVRTFINGFSNENGAEKIQKAAENIKQLRDALDGEVSSNSLLLIFQKLSESTDISGLVTEIKNLLKVETAANQAAIAKKEFSEANKQMKKSADESSNALDKEKAAFEKIWNKLDGLNQEKFMPGFNEQIEQIRVAMNGIDDAADDAAQSYRNLTEQAEKLWKEHGFSEWKKAAETSIASLEVKIAKFGKDNTAIAKEFSDRLDEIRSKLHDGMSIEEVQKLGAAFKKLEADINNAGQGGLSFFDTLRKRLIGVNAQLIAQYLSWQDMIRYTRQAINVIKELDYELVDLKKTTTMSADDLKEFYYAANDTAKATGVTTKEIISQAAAWSRLGYSSKDAATEMSALSSQFAQISPGMSVDTATDGLVSTMKAFHVDVADVEREIMDVINKTGNTMATDNEEIVNMLERSSAAMSAANNSIKETIALESAAVQITRNAETTGTAFRTKNCPYVQQCA